MRSANRVAAWEEVYELARAANRPVETKHAFRAACAMVEPRAPVALEELFQRKTERRPVWVVLDGVSHLDNIGTILRSAMFFGASGALVCQPGDALAAAVYDHACGGLEHVPYAMCTPEMLPGAYGVMKAAGIKVLATDSAGQSVLSSDHRGVPVAVVMGGETDGMSPASLAAADALVRIDSTGVPTCLNVGVAAGILLHELTRA